MATSFDPERASSSGHNTSKNIFKKPKDIYNIHKYFYLKN